jgi:GrpB-like predicted nucleotidyltransferase (UPF0157 family)
MSRVRVVPPNDGWAAEFEQLAQQLTGYVGEVPIHHIGSTAVPGLVAKDVIDVMVVVEDADGIGRACKALAKHGYRVNPVAHDHIPPGRSDPEQWVKGYASADRVHVHIRVAGRGNHRYALLFRDYLRAHPSMAVAYGEAKKRLGALVPEDSNRYADAKDPICDLIYLSAEEWATRTAWSPPA